MLLWRFPFFFFFCVASLVCVQASVIINPKGPVSCCCICDVNNGLGCVVCKAS